MCSRYELNSTSREIAQRFQLEQPPPMVNMAEIRPTDRALVIEAGGACRLLAWGLSVSWDKKPLINARAETLAEKKTFQTLLDSRCLVPASAYFEWRRDGKARFKNRIAPNAAAPFAFAGLIDGDRFTIVTCAPAPAIANIHNRMPVILSRQGESDWLNSNNPFADAATYLVPYEEAALTAAEDAVPPSPQPDLFE